MISEFWTASIVQRYFCHQIFPQCKSLITGPMSKCFWHSCHGSVIWGSYSANAKRALDFIQVGYAMVSRTIYQGLQHRACHHICLIYMYTYGQISHLAGIQQNYLCKDITRYGWVHAALWPPFTVSVGILHK